MAESSSGQSTKRQKKQKYWNPKKTKCHDKMTIGMRGILVFGADHEGAARREAYNLFNEYADDLFGCEFDEPKEKHDPNKVIVDYQHGHDPSTSVEDTKEKNDDEDDDDDDIEKEIAKEIDDIKKKRPKRRFQCVTTGVNAILFIKSTLSPCELNSLVRYILSDIEDTKEKKARNFSRIVPVSYICQANLAEIVKTVSEQFLPELNGDEHDNVPKRFCVNYKARFNNSVTRGSVVNGIASTLIDSGHLVDLGSPDKVIIVEVMKGMCCMSMVDDFYRFKRYNIHEIVNAALKEKSTSDISQQQGKKIPDDKISDD